MTAMEDSDILLDVENLSVEYASPGANSSSHCPVSRELEFCAQ